MKKRLLIIATLVCLTFAGCGANKSVAATSDSYDSGYGGYEDYDGYANDNAYDSAESVDTDYEGEEELAAPESPEGPDGEDVTSSDGKDGIKLTEDKIVYHGNLSVSTSDFDNSKKQLDKLMQKYEAILESDDFDIYNNVKHETISIRIPAGNFYDFINATGDIGKVTSNNTYSENITKQYIDVQARISAYEKRVERINGLIDQATDIADITVLYDELTTAEYELENAKSQLLNMDTDVAYSYLKIDITDTHRYTDTGDLQGDGSYWSDLAYSFWDSISDFVDFLGMILIGIVYLLPYLLLALVIIVIVKIINKKRGKKSFRQRRKEKKEQAMNQMQNQGQGQAMNQMQNQGQGQAMNQMHNQMQK